MKIRLPNLNGNETYIENKQSIILIGANGAGKTRMSVWIDENNKDINIHRISAQKSLNMPKLVSPTELSTAEEQFIYGTSDQNKKWLKDAGKKCNRWGNNPEIHLYNYNIFVPKVAEIENLFLLPEVIKIVARKQNVENVEELISITQKKTIDFLKENLNEQALLFTRQKCQNTINKISNKSARSISEYVEHLNSISLETSAEEVYDKVFSELQKIVDEKDYLGALRVINNKGLLPYTNLPNSFGWKKQYYIDYVLRLLNISDECSEELCNIFKEYVPLQ